MTPNDLRIAWDAAVSALRSAVEIADDLAPCAEQSRLREALEAMGEPESEPEVCIDCGGPHILEGICQECYARDCED